MSLPGGRHRASFRVPIVTLVEVVRTKDEVIRTPCNVIPNEDLSCTDSILHRHQAVLTEGNVVSSREGSLATLDALNSLSVLLSKISYTSVKALY